MQDVPSGAGRQAGKLHVYAGAFASAAPFLPMIKTLRLICAALVFGVGVANLPAQSASVNSTAPMAVPPPGPVSSPLPAPPVRPEVQPRSDRALIQRLTPRVEIWRPNSNRPQIPARRSDRGQSDAAFVNGTELVLIRLQFNPQSVGEKVTVIAARGILLDPPQQVLTISAQGDCVFQARLLEKAQRGHLITYCKNVRTVVPLTRAPLAAIQALEARGGGRP